MAKSITELETAIGLKPNTQSYNDESNLLNRLNNLETMLQVNLREWLTRQGIPHKSTISASQASLAKAYTSQRYLQSWRSRINPSWDLLGGASVSAISYTEATPVAAPAAAPAPAPTAQASEAWLKALYDQINKSVTSLVADHIAKATIKIDPAAKQQIQDLARSAAQAHIDLTSKPQIIEIHHKPPAAQVISIGRQHFMFPKLLQAVQARDHRGFKLNIWLTGPTGSGKTSAGEAAAKALATQFGSDGSLDADYKVLGFRDANGHIISTEFIRIYREGGIYIADEIDNWMPSALLSLNAALANGWMTTPGGMIQRHPDACVIACANTWGLGATSDYVGRTRLDSASLDRFQPKINWPYDEKLEHAIASDQGGQQGTEWFNIVRSTRAKVIQQGLKIIISPRATFSGISLLQAGFALNEVIDMTIAAGISEDQKKSIGLAQAPVLAQSAQAQAQNSDYDIATMAKVNKIEAIKMYKDRYLTDLHTAKLAVEAMIGIMTTTGVNTTTTAA